MQHITHKAEDMEVVAKDFLQNLSPQPDSATIVALLGDLGAGKTTFTQAIARKLGVADTVTSPTFVIQKSYEIPSHSGFKKLVHIDAYRINEKEAHTIAFNEYSKDPNNLIFIEWPSQIEEILPENIIKIHLEYLSEDTRKVWW